MFELVVQAHKKGIRALGISESFMKKVSRYSILAGVVMRADLIVDGFSFSKTTVGGMDATESVIRMYKNLRRKDINVLMLNGCVISWYNVIDLKRVAEECKIPLICVTYEESTGLEKYFMKYFPEDWPIRVGIYKRNGTRTQVKLHTGHKIYVRCFNLPIRTAKNILDKFTLHGAVPEPIRVARILARSLLKSGYFT